MAEIIEGDTSISKLLEEQKVTSQHLELFKDVGESNQDLLLEQMISNEELSSINVGLGEFSKAMMVGIKSLTGKISDIPLDAEVPSVSINPEEVSGELGMLIEEARGSNSFLDETTFNTRSMADSLSQMADDSADMKQMAEDAADVAGVSDIGGGKPEDIKNDGDKGSIGDLLKMFNPISAFGFLGKKFPKLGKFGKLLGKGLKILGPIAVAGMALFDFAKGVENAAEITGKPMESLSTLEKAGAGLAGVIEGITFGLIDAKDAYSGIASIASTVSKIGEDIFSMMPDSVQKGLTSAVDFLFDSEEGIFGFITTSFKTAIDQLSKGDFTGALWTEYARQVAIG